MGQIQGKELEDEEDEELEVKLTFINSILEEVPLLEHVDPLHGAIAEGDEDEVKRLLSTLSPEELRSYLEWEDSLGNNLLHITIDSLVLSDAESCFAICNLFLEASKEDDTRQKDEDKVPFVSRGNRHGKTPLHLAARRRNLELLKLFVFFGADPAQKDNYGYAPLHSCVEGVAGQQQAEDARQECVEYLLSHKINPMEPSGPDDGNQTVVHIAARHRDAKLLKYFLQQKGLPHSPKDERGQTPLMALVVTAFISDEDTEAASKCLHLLLARFTKDEINLARQDGQTAVMLAAAARQPKLLRILLSNRKVNIYATDLEQRTALHLAVSPCAYENNLECVRFLVEKDVRNWKRNENPRFLWLLNMRDNEGKSPGDLAISIGFIPVISYFITATQLSDSPSDVSNWLTNDSLESIYRRVPESLIAPMRLGIRSLSQDRLSLKGNVSCQFRLITGLRKFKPRFALPETHFLQKIVDDSGDIVKELLSLSLVNVFLHLKWQKFRWLLAVSFFLQFSFTTLYTTLVLELYGGACHKEPTNEFATSNTSDLSTENRGGTLRILKSIGFSLGVKSCEAQNEHFRAQATSIFLYFFVILSLAKEIGQLKVSSRNFYEPINYIQVACLGIATLNSVPCWQQSSQVSTWQAPLASIGILIAWMLSLREIGKIPKCGLYIEILKKVLYKCLEMTAIFLPLLIGFAVCLHILVPAKGQYNYILLGVARTLITMAGEINYDGTFYSEDPWTSELSYKPILGQLVIVVLVFIASIVLVNLLTGFAVSDVQKLTEEGEVYKLVNQLVLIHQLERVLSWMSTLRFFRGRAWFVRVLNYFIVAEADPRQRKLTRVEQTVEAVQLPADLMAKIHKELKSHSNHHFGTKR